MSEVKYPSQYEAEFVCDYLNALNGIHTGYAGDTGRDMVNAAICLVQPHRERCFGEKSPWELHIKRSRSAAKPDKLAVRWCPTKAKQLGL